MIRYFLEPPKIAGSEVRVVNVSQGESLLLVCEVQADPLPHIVWNKVRLYTDIGPFHIRPIFRKDLQFLADPKPRD